MVPRPLNLSGAKLVVSDAPDTPLTPRMQELLDIINSRDAAAIMGLAGIGPKKARDLAAYLGERGEGNNIASVAELRAVPGMGGRTVERACDGLVGRAL